MFKSLYFGLCFALAFLGLIITLHIDVKIGLAIFTIFIIKFLFMLPSTQNA